MHSIRYWHDGSLGWLDIERPRKEPVSFGMTPLEAVGATRFHHQLLPPDLVTYSVTRPLPEETIRALSDRGYRLEPHSFEFGDVQIISRDRDSWIPASDPRDRGDSRVISITDAVD